MKRPIVLASIAALILGLRATAWSGTLIDSPEWTNNEIYEILSTDPVEGAALGASFAGLGIDNEPHQQLANRTAFLHNQQATDLANISVLQAFAAGFISHMATNGYLKIPATDTSLGKISVIVEWGTYSIPGTVLHGDTPESLSWPIAFPHALFLVMATNLYNATAGENTVISVQSGTQSTTGCTFMYDMNNGLAAAIGGSTHETTDGFQWLAIGY